MRKRVFALVGILLLLACAGITARKEVLLRTLKMAWESSISQNVRLGGGDPSAMSEALKAGDIDRVLRISWEGLRRQALAGIQKMQDDGTIGSAAASILRNELDMFGRALMALGSRPATKLGIRASDVLTYPYSAGGIYAR